MNLGLDYVTKINYKSVSVVSVRGGPGQAAPLPGLQFTAEAQACAPAAAGA
jgi:hypothetical protein